MHALIIITRSTKTGNNLVFLCIIYIILKQFLICSLQTLTRWEMGWSKEPKLILYGKCVRAEQWLPGLDIKCTLIRKKIILKKYFEINNTNICFSWTPPIYGPQRWVRWGVSPHLSVHTCITAVSASHLLSDGDTPNALVRWDMR